MGVEFEVIRRVVHVDSGHDTIIVNIGLEFQDYPFDVRIETVLCFCNRL
jgi:hypothetical protein